MHSLREATPTPTHCGDLTVDTHALFNEPQRRRERRGKRERSHAENFAGDRYF
ncbi:MAG: hypothetical protein HWQ43_03965 [Nostoc sp. JL31]|uniref:hypothetical protein n=1 Tax=Nostoc sp. JL31 TaxID=2815395 RepID=UPI0025F7D6A5|nr:hypothetical protein [Nostoc sp. JL31]MBN3888351.1 hypothetical protein [Nostoc sp. JL31]